MNYENKTLGAVLLLHLLQDRLLFLTPSAPRSPKFDDERLVALHLVGIVIITFGKERLFGEIDSLARLSIRRHRHHQHGNRHEKHFQKRFHNIFSLVFFVYSCIAMGKMSEKREKKLS